MYDLIHKFCFCSIKICLPPASTISTVRFGWPPAFPCFIFLTAAVTLTSVTNTAEPSTATVLFIEFLSQENSTLKSFW